MTEERTAVSARPVYDGFISYSHAADDLLAPRLQEGLQRFAKPWWRRRAVRIFRDESSLAANPHLWSSITEALDDSSWFVLLLSDDAASSEWVGREIAHWTEHKPADRILPVVTDGTFGWENDDVAGSAVPPALHGVFSEEPRWVDLRFARGDAGLDLQNPDFSAAVADIAATIRGVAKDELASEEVRQHRRTVRTAWAAGVSLAVLAVAAGLFGLQSASNAAEAERQTEVAQENATEAQLQSDLADANAARAEENAAVAEENAALADENATVAEANAAQAQQSAALAAARELAASAVANLDIDPELATLLALAALRAAPSGTETPLEVENALWRAGSTNRLIGSYDFEHAGQLSLSPDGERLAVTTTFQELSVFDTSSGEIVWSFAEDTADFFGTVAWGPDGRIALPVLDSTVGLGPAGPRDIDDLPGRLVLLDGSSGALLKVLEIPDCHAADLPAWSPDGSHLAISNGVDGCPRTIDSISASNWVEVFDTTTWESVTWIPMGGQGEGPIPAYDEAGNLHLLAFRDEIRAFDAATYDPRPPSGADGLGDVSPDGNDYYVSESDEALGGTTFSAWKLDAVSGETVDVLYTGFSRPSIPSGIAATEDGRFVIVGTSGAFTHIYEADSGVELFKLPTGDVYGSAYDAESELLYTTSAAGGVKIWDLGESSVGVESTGDLGRFGWVNGTGFFKGEQIGVMDTIDLGPFDWAVQVFDLSTGQLVGEPIEGSGGGRPTAGGEVLSVEFETGTWSLYDPVTNDREVIVACLESAPDGFGGVNCVGEGEAAWYHLVVSTDGGEVLAFGNNAEGEPSGHVREYDGSTGDLVLTVEPGEAYAGLPANAIPSNIEILTADWFHQTNVTPGSGVFDRQTGDLLYAEPFGTDGPTEWSEAGELIAFRGGTNLEVADTTSWQTAISITFPTRIRGIAFDDSGTLMAVGTLDSLWVIEARTGQILRQVRLAGVSDVHWIDDETLLVGTNRGVFGTLSLSTAEFLEQVSSSLRRSFTERECDLYRIDPCPTLEELRNV